MSAVFLIHVSPARAPGGFLGVDLFFVLSGYLITRILLTERERTGRVGLARFYARRALRLVPALIVMVLPATLVIVHGGGCALDGLYAATYLTDVWQPLSPHFSSLQHTWSLSVEEQFYLLWPPAMVLLSRRGMSLAGALACLTAASIAATAVWPSREYIEFTPFAHAPELSGGALLALALGSAAGRARVARMVGPATMSLAVVALLSAVFTVHSRWWWIYGILAVVCTVPVAHLATHSDGSWARVLSGSPIVWLGRRSYAFYLWHFPILVEMHHHFGDRAALNLVGGLAASLLVTALSWRLVEQPFLRIKTRFEAPPAVVATSGVEVKPEPPTAPL